ncbi:MAG TPA: LLM class flavin-dependent oxidoreductase [Actinomycetota bacterium]|nr:LLM class flavin-dependent oxidoreductase [Actinomycetota bacterium]
MKVGLLLPMFTRDAGRVLEAARSAERLGFDGVFAFDHFFPPGAPPDRPALEAFTTLAAVAQVTSRVVVGTLVTRAVLRPAGLVAKMAATLDLVSGGRMVLGVGTGDPIDRPEHRAFGFPELSVRARREHLAETVRALKAVFRGERFPGGDHVPALDGPLLPPPVRPGGPPVWVGAQADEAVRIAGALADGWNGWGFPPEAFRRKAELLSEAAGRAGREAEATWAGIALVGEDEAEARRLLDRRREQGLNDELAFHGTAEEFAEYLRALARAGASWAIVVLAGPRGRRELVAERVLPALGRP